MSRWIGRSIVALIIISGLFFGARLVHFPLSGFFSVQNRVKIWWSAAWSAPKLSTEVENFKSQVRSLTSENARLQELQQENLALRKILQFTEKEKYPIVVARVIARINEGGISFLLINRGREQGIVLDAPVLADNVLIGKIVKVQDNSAHIIPLIAMGVKTAATFAGASKTSGVVEGELNASLMMRLIPKDVAVTQGMNVVTSGLEARIPAGLLIGTVERVEANPQELFQTAALKLLISLDEISLVSVITQ